MIKYIKDLDKSKQELFMDYVRYVIIIDDSPVGGYRTKAAAENDLPRQIKEFETYKNY